MSHDRAETTKEPTPYCRACAKGLPVVMLDEDGTGTDISNRPGVPSHASGDAWWPCPLWQRVTAPTPETQADAGYRATAGDALIRAVNEWMPHATACNRYNCPVCVTLINRLRLAYKVWQVSAHKGATTEPIVLVAAPETLSHLLNRLHVAFCEMVILASSEEVADAEVAGLEYEGHAAFNALHALLAGAVSHPQPEVKTTNDDEVARGDRRGLSVGFGTAGSDAGAHSDSAGAEKANVVAAPTPPPYDAEREARIFLAELLDPDAKPAPVAKAMAFLRLWANSYLLKGNYWDVPQTMGAALLQVIKILDARE